LVKVVILDACRDNPPYSSRADTLFGGEELTLPPDTLLLYAAGPGEKAGEGRGDNSLFTAALLRHLQTPGLSAGRLFALVRRDVRRASAGRQTPCYFSTLKNSWYFLPGRAAFTQP
jgi:uncharacterized caspase-like protein